MHLVAVSVRGNEPWGIQRLDNKSTGCLTVSPLLNIHLKLSAISLVSKYQLNE